MDTRTWRIGELAAETGLTVRALRHYEHERLLVPSGRTAAAHRVYSNADVARLYEILVLRRIGLGLAAIREQLESPRDLGEVVAEHLAQTREAIAAQQRIVERLQRVAATLESGQPASEVLLRVMEDMTMLERNLVLTTEGPNLISRGKVRDIYALPPDAQGYDRLLLVATDRISAFDVVLPAGIPRKGEVLTRLSAFWYERTRDVVPNAFVAVLDAGNAEAFGVRDPAYFGRSMVMRRAEVLKAECVVRGYLAGSGWRDYQQDGAICGIALPPGLRLADRLLDPLFTPSTKADPPAHDAPMTYADLEALLGVDVANAVRLRSLALYRYGATTCAERGIIVADTKFEFGMLDGEPVLIDEVLTPDSSRFWPRDQYDPGHDQPSFDKQPLRDWLDTLDWDKQPPGPALPPEIVEATSARYLEGYRRITGDALPD